MHEYFISFRLITNNTFDKLILNLIQPEMLKFG